ncbi:MAG: hypothetical protein KAS39_07255 [Actinomycetia bacterium]|nr:hypothetical protein [Actinomycetes bacterium]
MESIEVLKIGTKMFYYWLEYEEERLKEVCEERDKYFEGRIKDEDVGKRYIEFGNQVRELKDGKQKEIDDKLAIKCSKDWVYQIIHKPLYENNFIIIQIVEDWHYLAFYNYLDIEPRFIRTVSIDLYLKEGDKNFGYIMTPRALQDEYSLESTYPFIPEKISCYDNIYIQNKKDIKLEKVRSSSFPRIVFSEKSSLENVLAQMCVYALQKKFFKDEKSLFEFLEAYIETHLKMIIKKEGYEVKEGYEGIKEQSISSIVKGFQIFEKPEGFKDFIYKTVQYCVKDTLEK